MGLSSSAVKHGAMTHKMGAQSGRVASLLKCCLSRNDKVEKEDGMGKGSSMCRDLDAKGPKETSMSRKKSESGKHERARLYLVHHVSPMSSRVQFIKAVKP